MAIGVNLLSARLYDLPMISSKWAMFFQIIITFGVKPLESMVRQQLTDHKKFIKFPMKLS